MFGFQPCPDDGNQGLYIPPEEDPECFAIGKTASSTSGTSHTINMPTFSYTGSNCVLVIVATVEPTISGWTLVRSTEIIDMMTAGYLMVFHRASAGLGSTITATTGSSAQILAVAYEVTCNHLGGSSSAGVDDTPEPAAPSPSQVVDVLQMCAVGYENAGGIDVTSFAAGYSTEYHNSFNSVLALAVGWKFVSGGTETPGITTLSFSAAWATAVEVF